MSLIFLVAGIITVYIFSRQEQRHRLERARWYGRLRVEEPPLEPRLPMIESQLLVLVGIVILAFGMFLGWDLLFGHLNPGQEVSTAALVAGLGAGLIVSGIRGVRRNVLVQRSNLTNKEESIS